MLSKKYRHIIFILAYIFLVTGHLFAQNQNIDSLLTKLRSVKSDTIKIEILNKIAQHYQRSNTDSGLFYIKQSINLANKNNILDGLAAAHLISGSILKNMGSYSLSLKEHQKALKLFENQKDTLGIAKSYNSIGLVHIFQNNESLALEYFFLAKKIAEEINNEYYTYTTINNIGYTYQRQEKYAKAIEYFKKVITLDTTSTNLRLLGHTYLNLGRSYLKLKNTEQAIYYHNKSLKANMKIKSELGKTFSYLALADLYFELAQKSSKQSIKHKNLTKAIVYATKAYKISLANGYKNQLKVASYKLYQANTGIGNLNDALKYLELHLAYKDSIYTSEKMKEIENLELTFQSEKKKLQIENLEKANQVKSKNLKILQNRQLYLSLAITLFLAFILVLLFTRKKLKFKNNTINKQKNTINTQLEEIAMQNESLERHKNYLEKMIQEQTKDLIEAKEMAEHADKLKTAFLENLSHEIRTPLNAIVGFSNLMEFEENLSKEGRKFVAHINNASDSLLRIIESIMQVSNMQLGEYKLSLSILDVQVLFKSLFNEFSTTENYAGKKNLVLKTKIELTNKQIETDANFLKTILYHLIDNALKFTETGYVEFSCRILPITLNPATTLQRKKDNIPLLQFQVKDTGIGINNEDIKFIFDKFRKIDVEKSKLYRGLGLGLTIVKNMVEQLGGEIWVESEIAKGSTFYFTIPYKNTSD